MTHLPLMDNLPRAAIPHAQQFILASGSPRRRDLLTAAGYQFLVDPASDEAESGVSPGETALELVARYSFRKALEVAARHQNGMILAADTVAACDESILGKPRDRQHAESMLKMLSGRRHNVYTGVCLWSTASQLDFSPRCVVDVVRTELEMNTLDESALNAHLDSKLWEGKAGAFGFQDGNDWLRVLNQGSESNVVGLPMERLAELLENFDQFAETVSVGSTDPILPLISRSK